MRRTTAETVALLYLLCLIRFTDAAWHTRVVELKPPATARTSVRPASSTKHPTRAKRTPWKERVQSLATLVEGNVPPGPRFIHHILYWLTAADAVNSVRLNQYCILRPNGKQQVVIPAVYSKLFYFARLRPRLLYSVGALLRALQLCTPLHRVIDPSAGVGAGINLCALLAGSRWVKPLVLGFATTKLAWTWLGAKRVEGAHVPITLAITRDGRK